MFRCSIHFLKLLIAATVLLSSCTERIPDQDFDARRVDQTVRNLNFKNVKVNRKPSQSLLKPPSDPYVLGPGDIVEIEVSEVPGTLARTFVMPDGKVYYNLAGGVRAEGLTQDQFASRLTDALRRDYTNPLVNVSLVEVRSRRFWILGRVFKPGLYPLRQPTTLLEGVSLAGGLFTSAFSGFTEELADLSNSVIIRNGEILPVDFKSLIKEGDSKQNIYLQHNDYIYIPSTTSSTVLVLGAVGRPQAIPYNEKLTLIDSLAQCRGPSKEAYLKEVVVVRGTLNDPQAAIVNLKDILVGEDTDVLLQPGDIVWIPKRPYRYVEAVVQIIFQDAARTIAANEGDRLAGGVGQVGVALPLGSPSTSSSNSNNSRSSDDE
ncbi:polysaccharide biosynthesis/export family protein [Rubritalea marina]|uniref:polysaccharide biosynthesis/export family protein n=1 Tax=Rubritalea marina TaxID=361055 RepID=UPI000367BFBB|nr:polysaccharide biosynthesis/export family protein [Rubritalea marina]